MGSFSTLGGVTRHIDLTHKEVGGVINHADRSVTRLKLEYPTTEVSLAYLLSIGKVTWGNYVHDMWGLSSVDTFADHGVEGLLKHHCLLCLRCSGTNNVYDCAIDTGFSAADFFLDKIVAGTFTRIGIETVDLVDTYYRCKLTASGSTLKAYRVDMATPKISVTDTSLTSGITGIGRGWSERYPTEHSLIDSYFRAPSSPSPIPIAYFEIPIIGSGGRDDPFRAQMPEEIVWNWDLNPAAKRKYDIMKAKGFTDEEIFELFPEVLSCRTNRLSLTHSSLIKSDSATGKPREYVAIVRVFEQPDRQPHLRTIAEAITALRAIPGVRQLSRDEAIRRAKQIDDKLHDFDLISVPKPETKHVKEYIEWRKSLGVREELIDEKLMTVYVGEYKGW